MLNCGLQLFSHRNEAPKEGENRIQKEEQLRRGYGGLRSFGFRFQCCAAGDAVLSAPGVAVPALQFPRLRGRDKIKINKQTQHLQPPSV